MTNKERSVEEITLQFAGLLDSLKARIYQAQSRSEPGVDSAMVKVINVFEETLQAERQKREEEVEQLIKYDLYGEARALDIPMDTVKKLQEALTEGYEK